MNLERFDSEYVDRLRRGEPSAERHFSSYFGELLSLKLRSRLSSPQLIEDIRQETLMRVLRILREKGGIEYPERFGSFVNSICNYVLLEYRRAAERHEPVSVEDPPDPAGDPDAPLVKAELIRHIHRTLERMPPMQRGLLRAVFLEEADKAEVCRRYGVEPGYLRVLLHRAKARFRSEYLRLYPPRR